MDLFAKSHPEKSDSLNVIGVYSTFHEQYGYYADPVDDKTATLPKGWRARLVNLPPGDTDGVLGLCLDPHDLAIAKYVASREKDLQFNRELVSRGLLERDKLLHLLEVTPLEETQRARIAASIELDFGGVPPTQVSGVPNPNRATRWPARPDPMIVGSKMPRPRARTLGPLRSPKY